MTATYIAIGAIAFLVTLGFTLGKIASRMDKPERMEKREEV